MTPRILPLLVAAAIVAGCGKEEDAGFTGIGNETSQSRASSYSLDFTGIVPGGKSSASPQTAPPPNQ